MTSTKIFFMWNAEEKLNYQENTLESNLPNEQKTSKNEKLETYNLGAITKESVWLKTPLSTSIRLLQQTTYKKVIYQNKFNKYAIKVRIPSSSV